MSKLKPVPAVTPDDMRAIAKPIIEKAMAEIRESIGDWGWEWRIGEMIEFVHRTICAIMDAMNEAVANKFDSHHCTISRKNRAIEAVINRSGGYDTIKRESISWPFSLITGQIISGTFHTYLDVIADQLADIYGK